MVFIEKHLKKDQNPQHIVILKKYKLHFSPLVLPQLAVKGYQINPNPSFRIFFSQIALHDKKIVER